MQQLASKNYSRVEVYIRDEPKPFTMNVLQGQKLMDFLVGDNSTKHVKITDVDGNVIVELISNIIRVVPIDKPKFKVEDYV
jgi:hypothetical protein